MTQPLDMQTLVKRNGSTVLVGAEESMASLVLYQTVFELMGNGCTILELLDFKNESIRPFAVTWCDALEMPKALLDNFHIMENYELHHSAPPLADAIKRIVLPTDKPLVVFRNLANQVVATTPEHPWLKIASYLPLYLENSSIITSVCYGSSAQPAPPMDQWPADKLWLCTPGRNFGVKLTEYRPGEQVIRLEGKNYHGGLSLFTEIEEPTNAG